MTPEDQINQLAEFILANFPNEPGRTGKSEGAIETAIRIMKERALTDQDLEVLRLTYGNMRYSFRKRVPVQWIYHDNGDEEMGDLIKVAKKLKLVCSTDGCEKEAEQTGSRCSYCNQLRKER